MDSDARLASFSLVLRQLYLQANTGAVDRDLVEKVIRSLAVYPIGSVVELNTGERAVVVAANRSAALKPTVRIIVSRSGLVQFNGPFIALADTAEDSFERRICSPYPTGKGLGAVLAFNDITRQLAIENELRSLASIAEASPIAIVELNEDANLIHANPTMMSLMDRFRFGAGLHAAVLAEQIEALMAECLAKQTDVGPIEISVGEHCFEWKLVPVAGERIARGYGVDLTARKRTELALARAKIEAEAANLAKSEFLANMSHGLRTPVNRVIGMAELLVDSELTDEQRDYAKTSQTCAESLMGVIEKILARADLEAGRATINRSVFDLGQCLRESSEPYRCLARQKGLRFTLAIATDVPGRVLGDRSKLEQVLQCLLSNALKFTQHGEIIVDVRLTPTIAPGMPFEADCSHELDDAISFTISDTGIGIEAAKQGVIFERFVQADGSSTRSFGGADLGLAIAKQLVVFMGGAIGVESEPGKGSCFWFVLPLAEAAPGSGS